MSMPMSCVPSSDLVNTLSDRDLYFLYRYSRGDTLYRLGTDVLGLSGGYMSVCGRTNHVRNRLLKCLGLDVRLSHNRLRHLIAEFLDALGYSPPSESESSSSDPSSSDSDESIDSKSGRSFGLIDAVVGNEAFEQTQRMLFAARVRYLQVGLGLSDRPVKGKRRTKSVGNQQKILVLSDLHIPFHHEEAIRWALETHADADVVVLLGDLLDMYSASRFSKDRLIHPLDELMQAAALIELLAKEFPRVVILEGNHDTRAVRRLQTTAPELAPLLLHPFDYLRYVWSDGQLLERYPNVEFPVMEIDVGGGYPVRTRHLTKIGDALLGHFERSLKGPGRTVYGLAVDWLSQWEHFLFGAGSIRVLVEAHVHRLAKLQWGRLTLFESGCMSRLMQYVISDPRYAPPSTGGVVLVQRDGVTDINASNYFVAEGLDLKDA